MKTDRQKYRTTSARHSGRLLCAMALMHVLASPALAAEATGAGTVTASPAASRWTLPEPNLRKRASLLGGPSRIEQVLARQGSLRDTPSFVPAAIPAFSPVPEPERTVLTNPNNWPEPRTVEIPHVPGTPNLFGSVGIPVDGTPLDAKWRKASAGYSAAALGWTGPTAAPEPLADRMAMLEAVNAWVNERIEFTDDAATSGENDQWSNALETLARGRGDCEDYALAKMQVLSALGFSPREMYLVVVRDLVRRADHAVMAIEMDGRFLILDNVTNTIMPAENVPDYRPIFSYSSAGQWIHGYANAVADRPIITAAGSTVQASGSR